MNGEVLKIDEVHKRLQDGTAVYVDVRSTGEFQGGHAAGAYHVPLIEMGPAGREVNERFVAAVRALRDSLGGDGAPELIVACQAGGRSKQACQLLVAEGITKVSDFSGGWGGRPNPFGGVGLQGWGTSGNPTSTTTEDGRDWPSIRALMK